MVNQWINQGIFPAFLGGTVATVVLVQTQQVVSLSTVEINQITKSITVKIDGPSQGTGFIIDRKGNTYKILTNWHVLKESGNYTLTTVDGETYPLSNINRIVGIDAAVANFTSNKTYQVATLGDSNQLQEGQTLHYGGYPAPDANIPNRNYNFYGSQTLNSFLSPADQDGYELQFSGAALPGMSGSPILDDNGRVIGIYGKTAISGPTLQNRILGIPIDTVKKIASRYNIALTSPNTTPTPTPVVIRTPEPTPTPKASPSPKPTPSPVASPSPKPTTTRTEPTLISRVTGIDYTALRDLLAAGKWKEADQKTTELMLKAAKRSPEQILNEESIKNFSCEDLQTIDRLWREHSYGLFGFSIQKKIWQQAGGDLSYSTDEKFMEIVGWKKNQEGYQSAQVFNLSAPKGHLPFDVLYRKIAGGVGGIFWRRPDCKL